MTPIQSKLLLTGGHVTVAIALVEVIRERFPAWEIVFVGRKFAFEGKRIESEEYRLIRELGIRFLPLVAGRLTRTLSFFTLLSLLKVPVGFFMALWYVIKERPSLVVSFGGYVGLPVVAAGKFLGVPVIAHEQTRVIGLATKLASWLGSTVCVSFPELARQFPRAKAVYTGLPVRRGIFATYARPSFLPSSPKPILYITGGSTGAVSLNTIVFPIIPQLTKQFVVIHQTGNLSFPLAQRGAARLPEGARRRYVPVRYLDIASYAWVLAHAKLVVGRSGANTVGELAAMGKVAVLIPLPWSGGGEQRENALFLARAGGAMVVDQRGLTGTKLLRAIDNAVKNYPDHEKNARRFARNVPTDAASRLLDVVVAHMA